jgi:hypothetical protein
MQRIAASIIVLTGMTSACCGLVSTNVPLGHWSYSAVEKLASYGFIDSAMLTVRPVTRIEMARHVGQAMEHLRRRPAAPGVLVAIVDRLREEYRVELIAIGVIDEWHPDSFVKPIEDPYVSYLHAEDTPDLENIRGDRFYRGSNYRAGFASRIRLFETVAFYLHPEYLDSDGAGPTDVDLIEAYGKVALGDYELQLGKDSLWWGPGAHGSLLMSNNARPFTMAKLATPQPIQLPWVLRRLGLFKFALFLAELEKDRDIPEAKLTGLRVNLRPHPQLEVGLLRAVMVGGDGAPEADFGDYAQVFIPTSEQDETNQLAGFDVSFRWPMPDALPLRAVTFYGEFVGEDEAGFLPSKWGKLAGAKLGDLLKTGRTDLRVEYADNHVSSFPNVFYSHSLYTSGYTYKGRVIGHHMGTDSRDLYVCLSHYLTDDLIVDFAFDRQTHRLSSDEQPERDIFEGRVTFFAGTDWRVHGGYRFETCDQPDDHNHIFRLELIREF